MQEIGAFVMIRCRYEHDWQFLLYFPNLRQNLISLQKNTFIFSINVYNRDFIHAVDHTIPTQETVQMFIKFAASCNYCTMLFS